MIQDPVLATAVALVIGLLVGSFLNVVIHRLPRMMERAWRDECAELSGTPPAAAEPARYNLFTPASHCPHCAAPVSPVHNIPVISYLALRGRCARCGARISARYVWVELGSGLAAAVVVATLGLSAAGITALGFTFALIVLSGIDLEHMLLPDSITLPLLWAGLAVNLAGTFTDLHSAVLGAMAGYLSLWSVHVLFRAVTGKEGMGAGDFKLLAALGAWLGWQALPVIVILASGVGTLVGIALIVTGRSTRERPLPFGPYLAAAGFIALLWGDALVGAYIRTAGLGG